MEKLRINETPVRTSRNFLINNIEVELEMPEKIAEFKNVQIIREKSNTENLMREEVPGISRLPQITHETTIASRRLPCMQTGIAQYFFYRF